MGFRPKLAWKLGFGPTLGWKLGFRTPLQDPQGTDIDAVAASAAMAKAKRRLTLLMEKESENIAKWKFMLSPIHFLIKLWFFETIFPQNFLAGYDYFLEYFLLIWDFSCESQLHQAAGVCRLYSRPLERHDINTDLLLVTETASLMQRSAG